MAHSSLSEIFHSLQFAKRLLALFAALSFLAALDAQAAPRPWTGAAGNGSWSNTNNWTGGAIGNDDLLFAGTNQLLTTNDATGAALTNRTIVFSNTAGAFTLTGSNAFLNGNNVANTNILNNLSTNIQILNLGLNFFGASTFNIATTSNSIILNGIIAGTNITKSGASTLFLNGTNTFSGFLTNNAGAIRVGNNSGLGTTNNGTEIVSGAALELTTNNVGGNISIGAEALSLAGTGINSAGALRNITGSNSYGGLFTLTAATRINSDAGTLTLTNTETITGATFGLTFGGAGNLVVNSIIGTTTGTVNKDGAGTLILGAANTYTGDTTVGAGVLQLSGNGRIADASAAVVSNGATFDLNSISDTVDGVSGAGAVTLGGATLTVSNSATNNLSGVLSGTGGLVKVGAGTQILSGTTNSYGGTTTIGAGVLNVGTLANAGQNSSIGTNGTIIITNGGVLQYGGSTVSIDRNINLASGSGVIGVTNSATSLTIAGVISNTGSLVKTNAGELILSGANTYSGTTLITNGVLNIQNNTGLGATNSGTTVGSGAALELEGGVSIGAEALTINGTGISAAGALRSISGDNTYGGLITLGSASEISADSGTLSITNTGTITGNTFGLTLGGAGNINLASIIGTTSGTVTKDGAGTATLTGANTYTGATTASVGALRAANATALGTTAGGVSVANGAALELSGGITIGAETLALSGTGISTGGALRNISGDNTYQGTITNTAASRINSDAGTLTLSGAINATNQTLTFGGAGNIAANGAITNSTAGLTKDGTGTLTMGIATNSYGGVTTIGGGVLQVTNLANAGANSAIGTNGSIVLTNGGTLVYAGTTNSSMNRTISLASGDGGIGVSNSAAAVTISGAISNTGNFVKSGAGTLILSTATNSYGGTTTIAGGTIQVTNLANAGANSAIGTNGMIILSNGGVFSYAGASNSGMNRTINLAGNGGFGVSNSTAAVTNSGVITNTGNFTKSGAGTLILSGSNNFSGTTTVSAGVLSLANTNALSASTVDYSSAGSISFSNLTGANFGGLQGSTNLALTNLAGTAVALNVGGNNSSTTYSGAFSGGGSLIKTGTGTLALSGNSSFSGVTTISNGAVRVSNANGLGATNSGTTVIAGAALELEGGITIGAEALTLSNNGISSGGALRSISGSNTYGGAISLGTGVAVGVDADSLTLNGGVAPGGGSSFTKVGAGTLILNSTSTATGIVTISGGTMQLGTNGAIAPVAMNVTNGSTFDLNGRNATLGAPLNLNVYLTGATLKSGAGTISLTTTNVGVTVHSAANANSSTISGNLNLGGNTNTFNVADGAAAEDLVVSAAVSNGGIIKTNTGVLVLSGANTYSGETLVAQGTLSGDSTSLQGNITNSAAVIFNQAANGTYAGILSGGGTLLKTNSGTLILTNANTQSGGTTIGQGALQIGNGGTTGSLAGAITNNGSLIFNRSDNLTQSNAITGTGNLTKTGAGTLTLLSGASYSGGTLVSAGGLQGSTASLQGNITNNGTVIFDQGTNGFYAGLLSGSGSVNKAGAGAVTFTTANSYTGETWIQFGTLELNAAGGAAKNTTSVRVSTNATLLISQNNQVNDSASVTLSGGTIRTAAGVSEAFGNLSVTGSGFLDFGTTSYANANTINFGTYTPSALLTINNFDYGSTLTFGSDLTSTINNSSFFTFSNGGIASSSWNGTTFTITAIPEPSTYLAVAGLLALMLWPSRRRLLKDAKSIFGLRAPMRDRLAGKA